MVSDKLKQAKCLFFSFRDKLSVINDFMPVACLLGSMILFFFMLYTRITKNGINNYAENEWMLIHCVDTTGIFILYMLSQSKTYRWYSWFSLSCLSILWVLNLTYVLFSFDQDIYYTYYVLIIYAIFVVLSAAKITNRC